MTIRPPTVVVFADDEVVDLTPHVTAGLDYVVPPFLPRQLVSRLLAQGFAALGISDEERLTRQFPVYDALYAYARGRSEES